MKTDCISLMTPETTYFVLPGENESKVEDWYELLIERIRESRSAKVLRPVFREEFFEAAWDITVVRKPKLRKEYAKSENIEDLADKLAEIQGRKRLCISQTSFLIFKMGVLATSEADQPFDREMYTELPVSGVSIFHAGLSIYFERAFWIPQNNVRIPDSGDCFFKFQFRTPGPYIKLRTES